MSRIIFLDQRRLDRVFGGEKSLTVTSFERAMAWFSANWPADLAWPDGVERPAASTASEPAASEAGAAA